jgi:hypothetical protein
LDGIRLSGFPETEACLLTWRDLNSCAAFKVPRKQSQADSQYRLVSRVSPGFIQALVDVLCPGSDFGIGIARRG